MPLDDLTDAARLGEGDPGVQAPRSTLPEADDAAAALDTTAMRPRANAFMWVGAGVQGCATGVNAHGHSENFGLDVDAAEDGTPWTAFLRGLVASGLHGSVSLSAAVTTASKHAPPPPCWRVQRGSRAATYSCVTH